MTTTPLDPIASSNAVSRGCSRIGRGGSGLSGPAGAPDFNQRLRFLQSPAAHAGHAGPQAAVQTIETHMSWVFIVGEHVLKLKKPVRYPYLDFSTLAAREFCCREEMRLNSRLAPGVYLGLFVLYWSGARLALLPESARLAHDGVIEWLVLMRRLPRALMLDVLVAGGSVAVAQVDALTDVLIAFYRRLPPVDLTGSEYVARFAQEQAINRDVLLRPQFALSEAPRALDRLDAALHRHAALLRQRADARHIVEGHGDLRPEHVCLLDPPAVVDALEFNAALRQVDPLDDVALLGMECEAAGAAWIGPRLVDRIATALGADAARPLVPSYTAYRALLRARLAAAHLLEAEPRRPQHWQSQAQRYVALAGRALDNGSGA